MISLSCLSSCFKRSIIFEQELREAAAANGKAVKPGSLADKVGMVSRYNEVNDKRK